jgi:hypothetical protein
VSQLIIKLVRPFLGNQGAYLFDHPILTAILHGYDKEAAVVSGQYPVSIDPALFNVIDIIAEDKQAA